MLNPDKLHSDSESPKALESRPSAAAAGFCTVGMTDAEVLEKVNRELKRQKDDKPKTNDVVKPETKTTKGNRTKAPPKMEDVKPETTKTTKGNRTKAPPKMEDVKPETTKTTKGNRTKAPPKMEDVKPETTKTTKRNEREKEAKASERSPVTSDMSITSSDSEDSSSNDDGKSGMYGSSSSSDESEKKKDCQGREFRIREEFPKSNIKRWTTPGTRWHTHCDQDIPIQKTKKIPEPSATATPDLKELKHTADPPPPRHRRRQKSARPLDFN